MAGIFKNRAIIRFQDEPDSDKKIPTYDLLSFNLLHFENPKI